MFMGSLCSWYVFVSCPVMCQPVFLLKQTSAAHMGSIFSLISVPVLSREGLHKQEQASHGPAQGTWEQAWMLGCGAHVERASSWRSLSATQHPLSRLPHFLAGSCIFSLRGF